MLRSGKFSERTADWCSPYRASNDMYLSSNHLLLGRSSAQVPSGPLRQTRDPRQRFEFIQKYRYVLEALDQRLLPEFNDKTEVARREKKCENW